MKKTITLIGDESDISCFMTSLYSLRDTSAYDDIEIEMDYLRFALTPEQKDKILHTLNSGSYDPYEWIPTVNFILNVLGYDDKIEHDDFDNPRWSNQ